MRQWPTCTRCGLSILVHTVNHRGARCDDGVESPTFTIKDRMMVYEAIGKKIPDALRHDYNEEKANDK